MQKFLIKDGQGFERDWGSSKRACDFAIRHVGQDAVCAVQGKDVLWFLPEHEDYFREVMGDFKVTNTASAVKNHVEAQSRSSKVPANAERVRHANLGDGSVINRQPNRVLVMFDSQKKATPVVPSFLETIEA